MKAIKPLLLVLFIISFTVIMCWLSVAVSSRADAQQPCPGIVRGAGNVNIRSTPSTIGNAPASTLAAGTPAPALAATNGWHTLCADGKFISGSVVSYSTNTPRPAVTPTQIQHNSVWCSEQPEVRRIGDVWFVECRR